MLAILRALLLTILRLCPNFFVHRIFDAGLAATGSLHIARVRLAVDRPVISLAQTWCGWVYAASSDSRSTACPRPTACCGAGCCRSSSQRFLGQSLFLYFLYASCCWEQLLRCARVSPSFSCVVLTSLSLLLCLALLSRKQASQTVRLFAVNPLFLFWDVFECMTALCMLLFPYNYASLCKI